MTTNKDSWEYRFGQTVAVIILLCLLVMVATGMVLFLDYALGVLSR